MTTLHDHPLELALSTTGGTTSEPSDELAGRLTQHLVATALVRKSVIDPVPFPVWWRVADALRASLVEAPQDAVEEVDAAIAALVAGVDGLTAGPPVTLPAPRDGGGRALQHAQVLVARLVLSSSPTSPTLLHVRLARLRRALLATTLG